METPKGLKGSDVLELLAAAGCTAKLNDRAQIEIRPRERLPETLALVVRENRAAVVAALVERDQAPPDGPLPAGSLACWDHVEREWVTWGEWMFRAAKRGAMIELERRRRAAAELARKEAEAAAARAAEPAQERLIG